MPFSPISFLLIIATVTFTVVGQLLVKIGMTRLVEKHPGRQVNLGFMVDALLVPANLLGLGCAVLAALCWMAVLSRVPLSVAYPFTALSMVLVLLLSGLMLSEKVVPMQWCGVFVVALGLWIGTRGA
jgi:drug/metabolite transporter (DMT)-like permease